MDDPLQLDDPGSFRSFLKWLGRPGYAVRNLMRGDIGGAARQLGQFGIDVLDAPLPGNALGDITRKDDFTEVSDLIGGMDDGFAKSAVNLIGGVATDPLTYLTFGAGAALGATSKIAAGAAGASRAAGGVRMAIPFTNIGTKSVFEGMTLDPLSMVGKGMGKGVGMVDRRFPGLGAQEKVDASILKVKAATGALNPAPWVADIVRGARAKQGQVGMANEAQLNNVFTGVSEQALQKAMWATQNVKRQSDGTWQEILPDDLPMNPAYAGKSAEEYRTTVDPGVPRMPVEGLDEEMELGAASRDIDPVGFMRTKASATLSSLPRIPSFDRALGILKMDGKTTVEANSAAEAIDQALAGLNDVIDGVDGNELSSFHRAALKRMGDDPSAPGWVDPAAIQEAHDALTSYRSWLVREANAGRTAPADEPFVASNILRTAYPPKTREAPGKYQSGIGLSNKSFDLNLPDSPTYITDDAALAGLRGMRLAPDERQIPGLSADALSLRRTADDAPFLDIKPLSALDRMMGATNPSRGPMARGTIPESVTARTNELLGGPAAPLTDIAAGQLPRATDTFSTVDQNVERWSRRVDAMGLDPALADEVKALLAQHGPAVQRQWTEGTKDFPGFQPAIGRDALRESPSDYAHRSYTGFTTENDLGLSGNQSSLKEKVLPTGKKLSSFLNDNPTVKWDDNLLSASTKRAGQQGQIAKRATIGQGLIEDTIAKARNKPAAERAEAEQLAIEAQGKALGGSGGEFLKATTAIIDDIAKHDRETGRFLRDAFNGMPPRGPVMDVLEKLNRVFKPAAVYGVIIPRFGAIVRNRVSAIPQAAATDGAEGQAARLANPVQFARDVLGAIDDGVKSAFGLRIKGSDLTEALDVIQGAFKSSGGVASTAMKSLRATRPELADAMEHGVLEGFTSSEDLIKQIGMSGWKKKFVDIYDMPGKMFKGVEDRMRLGTYLDLVKKGKQPKQAASTVQSAFFDYTITSPENRTLRNLIPFAQFTAKAIPQQAKLISRKPGVGVGLDQLYGQDRGEPLPPWIAEQTHVPLGRDSAGNPQVVAGLGLPWEALNMAPSIGDFGRDMERSVVASSQPGLKSIYSTLSGHDPYFRSETGSYSKVPLFGDMGAVGSAYNRISGTGVIQPVDSILRSVDKLTDSRKTLPAKLVENLLGANVVTVDQDRALQQILQKALEGNSSVRKHVSLYQSDPDPETQALLHQLAEAKRRAKKKREDAKTDK
ncbi:MAG: hypothetical protein H0U59_02600 [Gemmatimonadaceae bacterium]|nr:hypothetical protein [Gemmatimonadaceae bacterium]